MNSKKLTKLLFFALALVQFQANAQTVVTGPIIVNTTVGNAQVPAAGATVDGCVLTVTGTLQLDGNIYLRHGGQLIQTHTGASNVTGSGIVSVYQEGVATNYTFNYWCSPVGASGSGNGNFGITMLGRPTSTTASTPVTTTTSTTYNGTTSTTSLNIDPYWINTFVTKGAFADWTHVYAATSIPPGYGFTMKGSLGTDTTDPGEGSANNLDGLHQRYDFRGKPNDGDIPISLLYDGHGTSTETDDSTYLTLVGNPYPSAIDLNAFLENESFNNGFAYFWEQDKTTTSHAVTSYKGGYGVYAQFGSVYTPPAYFFYDKFGTPTGGSVGTGNTYARRYAPIGQGFMIKPRHYDGGPGPGVSNGIINGTDYMRNAYRAPILEGTSGSVFAKKANADTSSETPHIRFNAILDNGPAVQILAAFVPNATAGIDRGGDAENPNFYPSNINFLVQDKMCVINTLPFDIKVKLPLVFYNQAQANYKITVNEIVNLDAVSNVYLHDKISDQYYDIKNSFYDLTLPAGMNNSQFEITFQNSTLGVNDIVEKSFDVFQDNAAKKLIVSNPSQKELVACDLYDIAGKLIFSKKQLGAQPSYEFSTAELSDGIYIVRVASQDKQTKGQKIIVRH